MATYNPTVNDWMIRIGQLEQAITAIKNIKVRPGLVQEALRAEMKILQDRVEHYSERAFQDGKVWRLW